MRTETTPAHSEHWGTLALQGWQAYDKRSIFHPNYGLLQYQAGQVYRHAHIQANCEGFWDEIHPLVLHAFIQTIENLQRWA